MRPERSATGTALRSLRLLRAVPAENQKLMPELDTFVYNIQSVDMRHPALRAGCRLRVNWEEACR